MVDKLDLAEHITFTGYRTDIPELMRSVDIIVHQSTRPEPFGLVVIEAMASGKPVVAMKEGGPLDIISERKNGLLAESRNPAATASCILELLSDESFAEQIGLAARERVIEHFSAKAQSRKYADLFYRFRHD